MELNTCARPFARAAFEYAKEKRLLSEWSTMLSLCASVVNEPCVVGVLGDPGLSGEQRAVVLLGLCGGGISKGGANFIRILSENKRVSLLPAIGAMFEQLKAKEESFQAVSVTSAFPLTQGCVDALTKKIEARLGCSVKLDIQIDKGLMGGVVIKAGDLVVDGSLRARLTKLVDAMVS